MTGTGEEVWLSPQTRGFETNVDLARGVETEVVSVGEVLVVFRPERNSVLETSRYVEILVGGSEANVMAGLARLGHKTGFITKVPDNPLGRLAIARYRSAGVDVSRVIWSQDGRMGLAFAELASPPRKNRFIYDRAFSEASKLSWSDIDPNYVRQAKILHLSGITPALSESCAQMVEELVSFAQENHITVSWDVNYRSKLWSFEEASKTLNKIMKKGVDIVFVNRSELQNLFGVDANDYTRAYRKFKSSYGIAVLVISLGTKGCFAVSNTDAVKGKPYEVKQINRSGVGDAFVAGFLHGYLSNFSLADSVLYGQAMALMKYTILNENIPFVEKQQVDSLFKSLKVEEEIPDDHVIER